jgi:hypothetical protein
MSQAELYEDVASGKLLAGRLARSGRRVAVVERLRAGHEGAGVSDRK